MALGTQLLIFITTKSQINSNYKLLQISVKQKQLFFNPSFIEFLIISISLYLTNIYRKDSG